MRGRLPKAGSLLVALTMLASSCSSSDDADRDEPGGVTSTSSSAPPAARATDPLSEEDLVDALARGGIETFAEAADAEPVTGKASETMTIEEADCAELTGTFLPSFNAKGSPATFTGTARWTGSRVD